MKKTLLIAAGAVVLAAMTTSVSAQSTTYSPGQDQFATILFEDQWPAAGDSDYNDAVIRVNTVMVDNSSSDVTQIVLTVFPQALGSGGVSSGLALHLPVPAGTDAEAKLFPSDDPLSSIIVDPWQNESELVYSIYDDVRDAFGGVGGFINTDPAGPFLIADPISLEITFTDPVPIDPLAAPFDLFFHHTANRAHQVHMPQYPGTDQMDGALFNTLDDASTAEQHFITDEGMPWLLFIPEPPTDLAWPTEQTPIDSAFPLILDFAQSGGASSADWYESPVPGLVVNESQLPEPATLILLAAGLPALLKPRRRRN